MIEEFFIALIITLIVISIITYFALRTNKNSSKSLGSSKKKSTSTTTTPSSSTQPAQKQSLAWTILEFITAIILIALLGIMVMGAYNWLSSPKTSEPKKEIVYKHQITTGYTATSSGTPVYMKSAYWTIKPFGKIKVVTPDDHVFYDEPGKQNPDNHYSPGWYTVYGENIYFEVTQ